MISYDMDEDDVNGHPKRKDASNILLYRLYDSQWWVPTLGCGEGRRRRRGSFIEVGGFIKVGQGFGGRCARTSGTQLWSCS